MHIMENKIGWAEVNILIKENWELVRNHVDAKRGVSWESLMKRRSLDHKWLWKSPMQHKYTL